MPHSAAESPQPSGILKQETQDCASPSSYLGLNYPTSPRATPKSVSIATHQEAISPLILGKQKYVEDVNLEPSRHPKKPQVKSPSTFRLSGRPSFTSSPALRPRNAEPTNLSTSGNRDTTLQPDHADRLELLVDQVRSWIQIERSKLRDAGLHQENTAIVSVKDHGSIGRPQPETAKDESRLTISGLLLDLDRLERIVMKNSSLQQSEGRRSSTKLRKRFSTRKLLRKQSSASSDTDYFDGALGIPSSEAVLDNSRTLAYTGGVSGSDDSSSDELTRVASYRDEDAWRNFKFEIVRLAHTLRLKGWRRIALDMSSDITVQRLSGALTNAVYVVSPPPDTPPRMDRSHNNGTALSFRKPPQKLLLRIYGPNVAHLIDREVELAILQRLARKRIGPRLLGTFGNGRFEEYFHARPLTPEDLRDPETSRQIAKRMRELHDGIELLDQERDDGPFVWRNWDKWVLRVEHVVCWLDSQVANLPPDFKPAGAQAWKRRGFICGLPWKRFRQAVERYREWLQAKYDTPERIRQKLVFAHNDTQYGNILRMVPTGDSPLLLPQNTHKQLIVIDFEYANANLPGLEFANHFTEWCYNYHDQRKPYACRTNYYPTPEEQDRFVRAYVRHRPQFDVSTPQMAPDGGHSISDEKYSRRKTTSISDFMLDARSPGITPTQPEQDSDEVANKAAEDAKVAYLIHETRIWRLANTAQWVAWGIVQAKVQGMPDFCSEAMDKDNAEAAVREDLGEDADIYREVAQEPVGERNQEEEQEFDYLGYAQHRAMFFWGDAIQLGIIKSEELPEEVRGKLKTVPY